MDTQQKNRIFINGTVIFWLLLYLWLGVKMEALMPWPLYTPGVYFLLYAIASPALRTHPKLSYRLYWIGWATILLLFVLTFVLFTVGWPEIDNWIR